MTRNTSSVVRSKTGSQSNTSRPATLIRALHRHGAFLARRAFVGEHAHGVDEPPAEAEMGLKVPAQLPLDSPALKLLGHQRALLDGQKTRSSNRSSSVFWYESPLLGRPWGMPLIGLNAPTAQGNILKLDSPHDWREVGSHVILTPLT